MSLKTRIGKVEQNLEARYAAEFKGHMQKLGGAYLFTEADYVRMAKDHMELLREAPPKPVGKDKVDIEPTLRYMAQQIGCSYAEVLDVARQVIGDMEVNQEPI